MHVRPIPASLFIVGAVVLPALAGDGSLKVKDKSKPVRHALEQVYAALENAMERGDTEGILALRTDDYEEITCSGHKISGKVAREGTRRLVNQDHPPIEAGFTLGTIELNGDDEAVVSVERTFSTMQRMQGTLRKVDSKTRQDETWVKTPEGWRLRFVHNRYLEWYVDGKRVAPGAAYDPDAPPYEPARPQ